MSIEQKQYYNAGKGSMLRDVLEMLDKHITEDQRFGDDTEPLKAFRYDLKRTHRDYLSNELHSSNPH